MKNLKMLAWGMLFALAGSFNQELQAENYIVKDGKPLAEIVIPEHPSSSVRLAARELQDYIKKTILFFR